jgi:hypothetical protein
VKPTAPAAALDERTRRPWSSSRLRAAGGKLDIEAIRPLNTVLSRR